VTNFCHNWQNIHQSGRLTGFAQVTEPILHCGKAIDSQKKTAPPILAGPHHYQINFK
jgi:hypothetical protein